MNGTTGGRRARQHLRTGVLGVLTVTVVLVAACGGAAKPTGSSPSQPAGYQQYRVYSDCMRTHGAPFWPQPSKVSAGVFDNPNKYVITARILAQEHGPGWQAALAACRKLAPHPLPFTAAQISALRSQLQKLAACMRAHGITRFPSPVVRPSGGGFRSPGPGVHPDSAHFLAAQRACWAHAPRT